jgi:hypothetical protein
MRFADGDGLQMIQRYTMQGFCEDPASYQRILMWQQWQPITPFFFDPWPMAKSLKMCVTDLKSV